jgi:hypothetical protein
MPASDEVNPESPYQERHRQVQTNHVIDVVPVPVCEYDEPAPHPNGPLGHIDDRLALPISAGERMVLERLRRAMVTALAHPRTHLDLEESPPPGGAL